MYPEITTAELENQLKEGKSLNLVDVREPDEWQALPYQGSTQHSAV